MESEEQIVMEAIVRAWEACREVPFPIYEKEARALAEAAIAAVNRCRGQG